MGTFSNGEIIMASQIPIAYIRAKTKLMLLPTDQASPTTPEPLSLSIIIWESTTDQAREMTISEGIVTIPT
jgi:hypothetical protein